MEIWNFLYNSTYTGKEFYDLVSSANIEIGFFGKAYIKSNNYEGLFDLEILSIILS